MLVTEQEAREKWCPMAFEHRYLARSGNEGYVANVKGGQPMRMCIGSGCMMWRFSSKPHPRSIRHEVSAEQFQAYWDDDLPDPERPENVPAEWEFYVDEEGCRWVEDDASRAARRKGYCSFAGTPGVNHELA